MNSEEYLSILGEVYLPSLRVMFGEAANEMVFMQDNARVHTSAAARAWFTSHPEVELLNWPAYSPDLNPIENVWANMTRHWPDHQFRNRREILETASQLWENLRHGDLIPTLYRSLPNRLQEVRDNNGHWCSY